MHPIDIVVDIPSTIAVIAALITSLIALFFAWKFSKTVGGDMGAAFKYVMAGVAVFAVTRVDDVLKVSGTWAKAGIDYKRVLWIPHSVIILVAWGLIAYGFYRMAKAFTV
jgi:hypothetical protein